MTDKRLAPGDPAPDFTLPDADGKEVSLSSFRGQRVIVYFYPAAMTPGCTTQACDFRDNLADLNSAGITVLGISPDQPAKLAKFRDKENLTFPLLSDPDHAVLRGLRRVRREEALRQDHGRRDQVHVRDRRGRHDLQGHVRRQGHRPRRPAPDRGRRLSGTVTSGPVTGGPSSAALATSGQAGVAKWHTRQV